MGRTFVIIPGRDKHHDDAHVVNWETIVETNGLLQEIIRQILVGWVHSSMRASIVCTVKVL